jgi:hypothetical protein
MNLYQPSIPNDELKSNHQTCSRKSPDVDLDFYLWDNFDPLYILLKNLNKWNKKICTCSSIVEVYILVFLFINNN